MKIQKLEEVRKNVHQTHLEDLVLLGKEGFDELFNHVENFINKLENKEDKINTTVKIDGAPAVVCWHEFPGYPNDSICLKSFINGPEKAKVISSVEELRAGKYADSPEMIDMLSYCLELSKYIPSGEAWQGDCLFTKNTKEERKINGKNYITFLPNTIIYAFSEDNPGYENIKNADFGIAFHTIYSGSADNLSQSFRVDASRLNLPNNIYVLSPVLNSSTNKEDYDIDEILNLEDQLSLVESDLISDPAYNELVNNKEFQTFWGTFENKNYADNKLYQINVDTLIDELNTHLDNRASKMSKVGIERVRNIINNNKGTLINMVKALNIASKIKMLLWDGFNSTSKFDYDSFYYNNETGEYTPTTMEGVAMSDDDGNIVKIVDRPTFASNNRNQAFAKGFKHESLTEDIGKTAVIAWGRMNPPTIGHQKLVDTLASYAQGEKAKLYLSHTQNKKKDPLSYDDKVYFAKKAFEPEVEVVATDYKTIFDILWDLNQNQGYTNLIYVGGGDRIGGKEDITSRILSYNNKPTSKGTIMYNFDNIEFKNAGGGDADGGDREKFTYDYVKQNLGKLDLQNIASANLVRECVKHNDFTLFRQLVPFDADEAHKLYDEVKAGLQVLKENLLKENAGEDFEIEVAHDLADNIDINGISFNNIVHEDIGGGNLNTESDIKVEFNNKFIEYIEVKNTEQQAKFLEFNFYQDENNNINITGRDLTDNMKKLCKELLELKPDTEEYQDIARKLVKEHYSEGDKNVNIFAIKVNNNPAYIYKENISNLVFLPTVRIRGDYILSVNREEADLILQKAIGSSLITDIKDEPDYAKITPNGKKYKTTLIYIKPENIDFFKGSGGSFGSNSYYLRTFTGEKYRLYPVVRKPNYYGILGYKIRGASNNNQLYSLKASNSSIKNVDKISYNELTNYFINKI